MTLSRFCATMSDGQFINIPADRMEMRGDAILAWLGDRLVAYCDVGALLHAKIEEVLPR